MQLFMQGKQIGMGSIFFGDLQKFWCRHLGMLYMESQAEHGAELGQKFSQCDYFVTCSSRNEPMMLWGFILSIGPKYGLTSHVNSPLYVTLKSQK